MMSGHQRGNARRGYATAKSEALLRWLVGADDTQTRTVEIKRNPEHAETSTSREKGS